MNDRAEKSNGLALCQASWHAQVQQNMWCHQQNKQKYRIKWAQLEWEGHSVEHIPPPRNACSMRIFQAQYIFELERHSVEHITLPRNVWSTRTYRAQYIFELSWYLSFWRYQWWRITFKIKQETAEDGKAGLQSTDTNITKIIKGT